MSSTNQAQKYIEDLVIAIFTNRQSTEWEAASREVRSIQADHSARGLTNSGANVKAITKAYESAVLRATENTLEELSQSFRVAGRRDAVLFWNSVEPKVKELALSFGKSSSATALSNLRHIQGEAQKNAIHEIAQQFLLNLNSTIAARIHELRLKSQFIVLKTSEDRKSNGVPDVAVMMWFPNPKTEKPEIVEAAKLRYEAIRNAVQGATNGLATVNKFDDPEVVPQDRISASIEIWLEKAALVICDLGGHRHNVYYEFGYTRAIGTDVLLTCPSCDANDTKLHLGHWQRIEYNDNDNLKIQLIEKMKVILSKYDLSGTV